MLIQGFQQEAEITEETPDSNVHLEGDKLKPDTNVAEKVLGAMQHAPE